MTGEQAAIIAEIVRRQQSAAKVAPFDLEAFCGGHQGQLAVARCRAPFIHLMWARQTGKSQICDALMAENAAANPRSTNILLHLTGTAVEMANWFPVWKGTISPRAGIPDEWHNETERVTYYPNGSRVCFAGTDDMKNIRRWLGNRLDNSVVIIDEAQDQPPQVLKYILRQLLPPMLTETTRVILAGVLPDVPAGPFYDLAHPAELAGGECTCEAWRHFEFGRAANVHTPGALELERKRMAREGIPETDPQFQRDWLMKRVWDMSATAYRYSRERNGYVPEVPEWLATVDHGKGTIRAAIPHEGITRFTLGADPGGGDRTSVVVWGWGDHTREVQHVFEWVTARDTKTALSDIAAAMAIAREHYEPDAYYWDPGSGGMEIDTFGSDYGLPIIRAARKSDLPGQVRRNNDLLSSGRAQVMIGSSLEEDYQRARFDPDARARGQWKWATQWHPDPSEAARYALQGYYDQFTEPPPPRSIEEQRREAQQLRQRRAEARAVGRHLDEDMEAALFADE